MTVFEFASWLRLPKLEDLTLPFYSVGMWAQLLQRLVEQDIQLTLIDWNRSGAEKSGGSPSQRVDAAIAALTMLQNASVSILVTTAADRLNADCFREEKLPDKSHVRYTVRLKE